jgi:Flp pilus assembly protein TadG
MRRRRFDPRDERGMTLVMAGLGFLAFMAATMLAVDTGMFMVARTQSQHAADAGALAGAVALVFDDFDDRSASGPAVQSALAAAKSTMNPVMSEPASVIAADVTFPVLERVRVRVERSTARGNPLLPFIAPMIGITAVDVGAVAVAEVTPANAATCIKPWAVPDKWKEMQTPQWDPSDELAMFEESGPNKGNPLANPDIYKDWKQSDYTGFQPERQGPDYGVQILLKPGNPHQAINSSHFFPIALPGGSGGSWYEENIGGCWPGEAAIGEMVPVEPGNMTGPTTQGVDTLLNKDRAASWDDAKKEVVSSFHPSPRIVIIPVFDPFVYEDGRQHGRVDIKIANFVGFFIEELQGNSVLGRIVPMTGLVQDSGGPIAPGAFLSAIRLVQ